MFPEFIQVVVAIGLSFLWPDNVSLCEGITFGLLIHLFMSIWVLSEIICKYRTGKDNCDLLGEKLGLNDEIPSDDALALDLPLSMGDLTVPALPRLKCYFLSLIFILYCSVVDLQCCVSLRYTVVSYTYIYPFFSMFFSHIGYYRILSRVPSPIQSVLIVYLFYI